MRHEVGLAELFCCKQLLDALRNKTEESSVCGQEIQNNKVKDFEALCKVEGNYRIKC